MHPASLYLGLLATHHTTEVLFVALLTPQELGIRCAFSPAHTLQQHTTPITTNSETGRLLQPC
jgi:hypothetical protein